MWDAVRKIFRHDDAPDDVPPTDPGPDPDPSADARATSVAGHQDGTADTGPTTPSVQPLTDMEPRAPDLVPSVPPVPAMSPVPALNSESEPAGEPGRVEVSSPAHAPQGLAAEPTMEITQPTQIEPHDAVERPERETGAMAAGAAAPRAAGDVVTSMGAAAAGDDAATIPAPTREPPAVAPVAEPGPLEAATATPATPATPAQPEDMVVTPPSAPATGPDAPRAIPTPAPTDAETAETTGVMPGATTDTGTGTESPPAPPPADSVGDGADDGGAPPYAPPSPGETQPRPTVGAAPVESAGPLAPGTVVGDRYTIQGAAEEETTGDTRGYQAVDARSYERCWSCGSTDNGAETRFCQNCGAPIQNHPVTLVETVTPTGLPDEIAHDGVYLHVQPERRMFGAEGIALEVGAHSAEGPHHPNEDSYWYQTRTLCANSGRQSIGVAVFADGMGGYAPGSGLISARIASMVGASVAAALDARAAQPATLTAEEAPAIEGIVREGIAAANRMVLDEIARTGEMGATLVVAVVYGDSAYIANIGDSRAYYVDPRGQPTRITRDQSLVGQEVAEGNLAEGDMYTAPGSNIILHAIGEEGVEQVADWYTQPLEPGSVLLLCSDGYWKTMRGSVMNGTALRDSASLSGVARRMVDDALVRGSDDNTTVLLIAVT